MKKIITHGLIIIITMLTSPAAFSGVEENQLAMSTQYEPTFTNRFSLMLGFHPSLTRSGDMTNFLVSYARKLEDFWVDGNVLVTKGLFKEFSANNPAATKASSLQIADQENSLVTVGLGIGRETRYAQTLLPFDSVYEYMAANLTYNSYKEDFSGKTYTGPGILAKFAVYKKFGDYFSAGAHFNYNLAVVEREEQTDSEATSNKSLTLGFLTVGFDLTFYL